MKKLATFAAIITVTGCTSSIPMHSFSPSTTSDGRHLFTLAINESALDAATKDDTIQRLLSNEMGRSGHCPKGYDITNRTQTGNYTIYEGECR